MVSSSAVLILSQSSGVIEVSFVTAFAFLFLAAFVAVCCAQAEHVHFKRLTLLGQVSCLFAGSEDGHRTLAALTKLLRASEGAATCILAVGDSEGAGYVIYQADTCGGMRTSGLSKVESGPLRALMDERSEDVLVYGRSSWWSVRRNCVAYSSHSLQRRNANDGRGESLAMALAADGVISLPLRTRRRAVGHMYFGFNGRTHAWRDVRFLLQVATQTAVMIEATQAATPASTDSGIDERKRISRDLHDSTIQPYVGLKLGLEALRRRCAPEDELAHDIDELLQMTTDNIGELRSYVGRLKSRPPRQQKISIVPSIRAQAARFSDYHGINVQVVSNQDILVNRALFDELMHVTREGLYNVRRHTKSEHATICLSTINNELLLEIKNHDAPHRARSSSFHPRSISDRVADLCGRVTVEERQPGCTVVSVQIPL